MFQILFKNALRVFAQEVAGVRKRPRHEAAAGLVLWGGSCMLALAHRYNKDSRDQGEHQRLDKMLEHESVWGCTFVGECTEVCPKNVDPAGAIQQAKTAAAQAYFKRFFMPKGARENA